MARVELENLGWNILTVGFLGTLLFTLVEAWGLLRQNQTLWRGGHAAKGESISVTNFTFGLATFVAFAIYGVVEWRLANIINGAALSVIYCPIVVGLWKFKGVTRLEKYFALLFTATVVAMATLPREGKAVLMLLIFFGNYGALLAQTWELWRNKSAGVVDIRLLFAFLSSTVFWTIYAFAAKDWVLEVACPGFFILQSVNILLWFKYRPRSARI